MAVAAVRKSFGSIPDCEWEIHPSLLNYTSKLNFLVCVFSSFEVLASTYCETCRKTTYNSHDNYAQHHITNLNTTIFSNKFYRREQREGLLQGASVLDSTKSRKLKDNITRFLVKKDKAISL
jgi:hypothetical protein